MREKSIFFYPIAIAIFLSPYLIPWGWHPFGPWCFAIATLGLIGCAFFFYKGKTTEILGLKLDRKQLFICGIAGVLALPDLGEL